MGAGALSGHECQWEEDVSRVLYHKIKTAVGNGSIEEAFRSWDRNFDNFLDVNSFREVARGMGFDDEHVSG
jgi:hypothetical protein